MDKLTKASEGKTESRGGMNMDEIKEYLLSLPGADEEKINDSPRPELNKLLEIAINDDKVTTHKVVYATDEDLKLDLKNTILPSMLTKIILKYTETIIKVQSEDTKIVYLRQNEFNDLGCKNVVNIYIYGVLVMKDPKYKFQSGQIKSITGPVIIIGDASYIFRWATKFNSDISGWDTSKVTNMAFMFYYAKSFNSDISGWDTSNVENMSNMFMDATNFNQYLSSWDTSKVTSMSGMFNGATKFNSNLSGWDTSNVTNMKGMFLDAKTFNSDLSRWNTSKVTDMTVMFFRATNFNQDLSAWDTSNVEYMDNMFYGVPKFTGFVRYIEGVWKIIYDSDLSN